MSFHVGQQVVCVDDSPSADGRITGLQRGRVYTISYIDAEPDADGNIGFVLAELKKPPSRICLVDGRRTRISGTFCALRFRPVVKTDISIFTAMLTPVKDKVSA